MRRTRGQVTGLSFPRDPRWPAQTSCGTAVGNLGQTPAPRADRPCPAGPRSQLLSFPPYGGSVAAAGVAPGVFISPGPRQPEPSADPLELGGDVGLEGLPDGGHVIGPAQVLADQAVEAAPGRVLLGGLGPGHHVGDQVDPGTGDL